MAGRVILTGFMGSGKTAVGRSLAQELGYEFSDTDALVERRIGMSISDAFEFGGESFFRTEEEAVIRQELSDAAAAEAGRVISLGGGAVATEAVRELLEQEEIVVLLDIDVATAFERSRGGSRPLAKDRNRFEQLYRDREALYRQVADMVIDTCGRGVDDIVREIAAALERQE